MSEKKLPSLLSEYLSEIGKRGGQKGGKARAANLSEERRKEIAKVAAEKRWGPPGARKKAPEGPKKKVGRPRKEEPK